MADCKITGLEKEDPELYKIASRFGGTNGTAALISGGPEAGNLATLYSMETTRVVAGVTPATLPDIPAGEIMKHNDPRESRGAWIVYDDLVYDVTGKSCDVQTTRHPSR